jgi:hypothetical protein
MDDLGLVKTVDRLGEMRNAARRLAMPPDDLLSRKPITGITGCCARAASGHAAAAPPSSVMNLRRLN